MLSFASGVLIIKLVSIILILTSLFVEYKCSDPSVISSLSDRVFITVMVLCSIGIVLGYLLLTMEYWRALII